MHRDIVREAEIVEDFGADWRGRFAEMACCVADPDLCDENEEEEEEELPETLREPVTLPSASQLLRECLAQDEEEDP
jgi:hypothetical protein